MLHRCEKGPGTANLKEQLQLLFAEYSIDEADEFTFKQWTHTDGTRLITRQEEACDLLEEIVLQINSLTSHSFIAKAQTAYLSEKKESLNLEAVDMLIQIPNELIFGFLALRHYT